MDQHYACFVETVCAIYRVRAVDTVDRTHLLFASDFLIPSTAIVHSQRVAAGLAIGGGS